MNVRYFLVISFFLFFWALLLVRVYHLNIKSNHYYEALAKKNMIKKEWIVPVRGEILAKDGTPLAINKIGFKILLAPHLSRKKEVLEEKLRVIQGYFNAFDIEKMRKRYLRADSYYNHQPIEIKSFIAYDSVIPYFTKMRLDPLIVIEPTTKRYYSNSNVASHVIGYVSKANEKDMKNNLVAKFTKRVGKAGVEKYYNHYLEGELGYREIKVTAKNKEIEELSLKEPIENRNLTLTLDLKLQKYVQGLFKDIYGSVVVMSVKGEILAAGSFPEYDLNTFVSGISSQKWNELINDLHHPFTNKIVNGLYPPGSTIKMGVSLAMLETKKLDEHTDLSCSGFIELGKRKFRCWKHYGHNHTNMQKAIRESCDVYFYKGSMKVGVDAISHALKDFGLGRKTGVDLPHEFIGIVPNKEWKEKKYNRQWYVGETLVSSIGQGYMLSTPMQIATYTALLATSKLPKPHFAKKFGKRSFEPESFEVLSEYQKSKMYIIRRAMYEVCNHPKGTASKYIDTKVTIAGKTGTSQVIGIPQSEKVRMKEEDLEYYNRSHAWLTTYGPYRRPKYVVTVLVEHGGHGGAAAGPIVSKIYDKLIELGYLKI